jgi:pyridoxal phosphate enzyme (YggS family)
MPEVTSPLAENYAAVLDRLARAAQQAGRRADDILLLAVTKKFSAARIAEAYELGMRHFGENYVQEFEGKAPALAHLAGAQFHLIGHLQSNKTRKAAELFHTIQTVDSAKLAQRLDAVGRPLGVFVEVKLSNEDAKSGVAPEGLSAVADAVRASQHLRLRGLMTMPPWTENAEESRPYFARLRTLAEREGLRELSMGMSNDFAVAIQEGATMVRIGTALFGKRPQPSA